MTLGIASRASPSAAAESTSTRWKDSEPEFDHRSTLKERRWVPRRLALEAQAGLGMPVGALGANVVYQVTPWFGAGAGIGIGSGPNEVNLHYAALLQFRPFRGVMNAFYVGAALSGGGYRETVYGSGGLDIEHYSRQAFWAQADLGLELRPSRSMLMRFTWGLAQMLNPSSLYCVGTDCQPNEPPHTSSHLIPTTGIALGYLF